MKKYIIIAATTLLLSIGSAALWAHVSSDEFFDANAEALMDSRESDGGNTVYCYSESVMRAGYSYYDCGPCTRKDGEEGLGKKGTCKYKAA